MKYEHIEPGIFHSRPNRFIAKVETGGREETVHVKNTGRCRELLVPGAKVYLERSGNPDRKTKWDLIAVEKGERMINMDSQAPNKIVGEALAGGRFSEVFGDELKDTDFDFGNLSEISPEKTFGDSRFDFRLEDRDGRVCWMEVKGVTLEEDGIARFPDAPTERGVKHVGELVKAAKAGDPVAQRIFTITGEYIGIGLASVVNLLNPERIIIGGGVADAGDLLLAPLTETLKKRAMKIAGSAVEVVPAQLGNTAGVIGSSLLIES